MTSTKFVWKKKKSQDLTNVITVLQKTVKPDIYLDLSEESLVLNRSKQHLEQEHCKWHVNICPKTVQKNKKFNDLKWKLIRKIRKERGDPEF
jgi:hypothetical protein